jgi:hypothetical protein
VLKSKFAFPMQVSEEPLNLKPHRQAEASATAGRQPTVGIGSRSSASTSSAWIGSEK